MGKEHQTAYILPENTVQGQFLEGTRRVFPALKPRYPQGEFLEGTKRVKPCLDTGKKR